MYTRAQIQIAMRKIEEEAKTKKWTLHRKFGGSTPVSKCPKCGKVSALTFFKDCPNGTEFFDVCFYNKLHGGDHCDMVHHIFVRADKFNVPKYQQYSTITFVDYGTITAPEGIRVIKYR
jgi:hypothetical protein